jgi:hypothetical protein
MDDLRRRSGLAQIEKAATIGRITAVYKLPRPFFLTRDEVSAAIARKNYKLAVGGQRVGLLAVDGSGYR